MKTYIYMGVNKTSVVLEKWGKRVEVQPNEVVTSEVKLQWYFLPFDENILSESDKKIATQQKYLDVAKEQRDLAIKELKDKQKAELEAMTAEQDAKVQSLTDRLGAFVAQRDKIAENIGKAKEIVQTKIDKLTKSVQDIEAVAPKKKDSKE